MKRDIYKQLEQWKRDPRRKPLLLMGARQVGKTYILQEFAHAEYENCVYLNFEDMPSLRTLFEKSLDPQEIVRVLSIEMDTAIVPEKTLIIFDEVQECPEALNSLKYFCEHGRDFHICAAGSLLGVKLMHTKGFPVGKVNFLHLYPLSFFEFLDAVDAARYKDYIETLETLEPLPTIIHEKLSEYFKSYLFTGGMPEAILEYVHSQDFSKVRQVQQAILNAYGLDFTKHAPKSNIMKINQVWQAIPSQLAKENKKFIYSAIREGARAKEFEVAIQWLLEAGLIQKVYNISTPKLPLDAYASHEIFKIYLVDVGLLGAMTKLSAKALLHGDQLFQEFRGSLIENYVSQELMRIDSGVYYWTSGGRAEVDFVFLHDDIIYPIEVKAGATSRKKSLRVYAVKYKPALLIRASSMNLRQDGDILNCPLYLIGEIKRILALHVGSSSDS